MSAQPLPQARRIAVARLDATRIDAAFALLEMARSSLTLDSWRAIARRAIDGPSERDGILAARNEAGDLSGLAVFRVDDDISGRALLRVDPFVAVDLFDPLPVAEALLGALEVRALRLGCRSIHVRLAPMPSGLLPGLQSIGYVVTDARHVRKSMGND